MKYSLLTYVLLLISNFIYSQNTQNELPVKNTQIFYFNHKFKDNKIQNGRDFFKTYLYYLDENGNYGGKMMDSFYLCDSYFFNPFWAEPRPYNGRYDEWDLNNYLDNVFVRTKTPIIRNILNNKIGYIGNNEYSSLSYKFDINNNTTALNIQFGLRAPHLTGSLSEAILIGLKYYDASGNEIYVSSSYVGMSKQTTKLINGNDWQTVSWNIVIGYEDVKSVELYIMNYKLDMTSELFIDNVQIKDNQNNINYISNQESTFEINPDISDWAFYRTFSKSMQYLFLDRNSLISELNETISTRERLKIILVLPSVDYGYYHENQQNEIEIKAKISNYINEIENRFISWSKQTNNPRIDIAGLYFIDEHINSGREFYLKPILQYIKSQVQIKGWKLFGSPLLIRNSNCTVDSGFADDILDIFDVTWQQPNAFFYFESHIDPLGMGRDQELLRLTNELISAKSMNINIESRVIKLQDGEPYARINDYFDYGDKYGYINYSKLYYDEAGAHYLNAHSSNPVERVDYDNLYKFIRKSQRGEIINRNFEILDSTESFYRWDGNYSVEKNNYSFSYGSRELKFATTNTTNYYSEEIPIKGADSYNLTFHARELINDNASNSALVGVIFYDNEGNELDDIPSTPLTNLSYSEYYGHFYKYFNTSTSFNDFKVFFKAPDDAVKFKFYLRNSYSSTDVIEWKSLKIYKNDPSKSSVFYDSGQKILRKEKEFDYGNYSIKLSRFRYAATNEKISISQNKIYTISLSVKEILPIKVIDKYDKALVAIETFDISGNKIITALPNMSYSTSINNYYKYINEINQEWNKFSFETSFPSNVASIKVYIYNWHYNNFILFDNIEIKEKNSLDLTRGLEDDNLLNKDKWNEKTPLRTSYQTPVFYNEFINVCDISSVEFSALLRNEISGKNNDFLGVEFFDANYNVLLNDDISDTNLIWSDFKFWWNDYFDVGSFDCDGTIDWVRNQWDIYTQSITVPIKAKYMKISLHKLTNSNNDFLILNPKLVKTAERTCFSVGKGKEVEIGDNFSFIIYPNPSTNKINIELINTQDFKICFYEIFDLKGNKVADGKFLGNKKELTISKLSQGIYIIKVYNEENTSTKRFFKD